MLLVASIVIMLAAGWANYRNGLSSAFFMLIAVILSGLMAFNLWEPAADSLEAITQTGTLAGCEDLIALVLIFSVTLLALRVAMFNYLAPDLIDQHGKLQFIGAGLVGIVTGYLLAGFLVCAMQTLPLDEKFLDFEPRGPQESPFRGVIPPDRVWLYIMRTAGAYPLHAKDPAAETDGDTDRYRGSFDRHATFELRYLRYRRTTDTRGPMPYLGEFDRELYGKAKPR